MTYRLPMKKPRKRIHSRAWRSCVRKIKKKDERVVNPYAVCTSRLEEKSFKT